MAVLTLLGPRMFASASVWGDNAAKRTSLGEYDPARDYRAEFKPVNSILGSPGTLVAVDLATGELVWEVPLGNARNLAPWPVWWLLGDIGVPNLGGPITTASGLVFISATTDGYLRAFETATGEELWRARLPTSAHATPMTYRVRPDGRQFVVIAAGGHSFLRTKPGDALIAFALGD